MGTGQFISRFQGAVSDTEIGHWGPQHKQINEVPLRFSIYLNICIAYSCVVFVQLSFSASGVCKARLFIY